MTFPTTIAVLPPPSCDHDGDGGRSDDGGRGPGGCWVEPKFQSIRDTKPAPKSSYLTIKLSLDEVVVVVVLSLALSPYQPKLKKEPFNPVESIAVLELGNNLLSCTSVLTSVSTQVQKTPLNPVESIAVTESGNNLLSCTSVLTSGCRTKLYYPLYSGWTFPCMPHFFDAWRDMFFGTLKIQEGLPVKHLGRWSLPRIHQVCRGPCHRLILISRVYQEPSIHIHERNGFLPRVQVLPAT